MFTSKQMILHRSACLLLHGSEFSKPDILAAILFPDIVNVVFSIGKQCDNILLSTDSFPNKRRGQLCGFWRCFL